jgi:hypothetical protein
LPNTGFFEEIGWERMLQYAKPNRRSRRLIRESRRRADRHIVEAIVLHKGVAGDAGLLRLKVADVAMAAASYARLGVRVLRCSTRRAVLELPCGVQLVLESRLRKSGAA